MNILEFGLFLCCLINIIICGPLALRAPLNLPMGLKDCLGLPSIEMETVDRHNLLLLHNRIRNKVAGGKINSSASNINQLYYNKENELYSYEAASLCVGEYQQFFDREKNPTNYNVLIWDNYTTTFDDILIMLNNAWAKPVEIPRSVIDSYVEDPKWTSFAKVIWADLEVIGCGGLYKTERIGGIFYCFYSPANVRGGYSIYRVGSPASACPKNGISFEFTNLCNSNRISYNHASALRTNIKYVIINLSILNYILFKLESVEL